MLRREYSSLSRSLDRHLERNRRLLHWASCSQCATRRSSSRRARRAQGFGRAPRQATVETPCDRPTALARISVYCVGALFDYPVRRFHTLCRPGFGTEDNRVIEGGISCCCRSRCGVFVAINNDEQNRNAVRQSKFDEHVLLLRFNGIWRFR